MIAVITGDIVNSRKEPSIKWLPLLKEILNQYGITPEEWEIFRGDSFQLALEPRKALKAAIHIKAGIKVLKDLDVRMAIGVGGQNYKAKNISESNGSAFVHSGECFEMLKKQHLGIRTGREELDEGLNLLLSLGLLTMDTWSPTVAEVIKLALQNEEGNQTELAQLTNKSQSTISEALKRGGFDEIMQMISFYEKQIENL